MSGRRIRSWAVDYLLPTAKNATAVEDRVARGMYRHREVIIAGDERTVAREIRARGGLVVQIKEQRQPHPFFNRVPALFKQQFITALIFAIEGGMSAGRALETLIEQQEGALRARFEPSLDLIKRGATFLEAFETLGIFDETTIAIVEAGEEIGKLPDALRSASAHLEKSKVTGKLIAGAVAATALDLGFAGSSVIGVRYGLLADMAKKGPGERASAAEAEEFNRALQMAIVGNDIMIWGTALLIVLTFVAVYAYHGRNEDFRNRVDALLLKMPLLNGLLLHTAVANTSSVMATLIRGGVTFLQACQITARGTRMPSVVRYWKNAREQVEAGIPVARALGSAPFDQTEQMLLMAHRDSLQLASTFESIGEQRDEQAKKAAKRFGALAFMASLVYSAIGVGLALLAVWIQTQISMKFQ